MQYLIPVPHWPIDQPAPVNNPTIPIPGVSQPDQARYAALSGPRYQPAVVPILDAPATVVNQDVFTAVTIPIARQDVLRLIIQMGGSRSQIDPPTIPPPTPPSIFAVPSAVSYTYEWTFS